MLLLLLLLQNIDKVVLDLHVVVDNDVVVVVGFEMDIDFVLNVDIIVVVAAAAAGVADSYSCWCSWHEWYLLWEDIAFDEMLDQTLVKVQALVVHNYCSYSFHHDHKLWSSIIIVRIHSTATRIHGWKRRWSFVHAFSPGGLLPPLHDIVQ